MSRQGDKGVAVDDTKAMFWSRVWWVSREMKQFGSADYDVHVDGFLILDWSIEDLSYSQEAVRKRFAVGARGSVYHLLRMKYLKDWERCHTGISHFLGNRSILPFPKDTPLTLNVNVMVLHVCTTTQAASPQPYHFSTGEVLLFLDVGGKVFTEVIQQRLQTVVKRVLPDSQSGFRSDNVCSDMIFCARRLVEKYNFYACKDFYQFIDMCRLAKSTMCRGIKSFKGKGDEFEAPP